MRRPRLGYANVMATVAVVAAVGGGAVAVGGVVGSEGEIQGCFDKKGRGQGDLRLLVKGRCAKGERPISWNQEGPRGPAGASGSPDTPQQVLDKLAQVDGAGSALDADFLDGATAADFARVGDAFTKAESDARFLRSVPREVVVPATGTPAQNGQALRDAIAAAPAPSVTDPFTIRLTGGAYAPGAGPLPVPPSVTLSGAGSRATLLDTQAPVVLAQDTRLEGLFVFNLSGAGPAAAEVSGEGVSISNVNLARQGTGVAEALRVESGSVRVEDTLLTAAAGGAATDVRAVNVNAASATLIDTEVSAFTGTDELRGVQVNTGGSLTMRGGKIDLDDNDSPGQRPAGLRLAGGASTVRGTDVSVINSAGVTGVDVATGGSALSEITVNAASSGADTALESSGDLTIEASRLVADGAGDEGIQTFNAATEVDVATTRISSPTTATGAGTETCVFSYGSDFTALSAACL